jgi:hypothetical protein
MAETAGHVGPKYALPFDQMLKALGPEPTTVEKAIGEWLQFVIDGLKDQVGDVEAQQIDLICRALAVRRPLVPISTLARISGTPESAVRSFALDIGLPLLIKGNSLHFFDEPAETWFRERFQPSAENLVSFIERLRPLARESSYVASTLPQLLLAAGLLDELVGLAWSGQGLPAGNRVKRLDPSIQVADLTLRKGRDARAGFPWGGFVKRNRHENRLVARTNGHSGKPILCPRPPSC